MPFASAAGGCKSNSLQGGGAGGGLTGGRGRRISDDEAAGEFAGGGHRGEGPRLDGGGGQGGEKPVGVEAQKIGQGGELGFGQATALEDERQIERGRGQREGGGERGGQGSRCLGIRCDPGGETRGEGDGAEAGAVVGVFVGARFLPVNVRNCMDKWRSVTDVGAMLRKVLPKKERSARPSAAGD